MLVLALQFSKGTAGAGFVRVARPPGTPWQRSAVRSCRARGFGRVAGSLKTEEKTRSVATSSTGGEPTTFDLSRLTHQCTNWELVRTGTAVADQRLNSAP